MNVENVDLENVHVRAVEPKRFMPKKVKKGWKNLLIGIGLRTNYNGYFDLIETKKFILPQEAFLEQLRAKMWFSDPEFMTENMKNSTNAAWHILFAQTHFMPYNLTCFLTDYCKFFGKNKALAKSIWKEHELALYSHPPNFRRALRCANLALLFMPMWVDYGHQIEAYCRRAEVWKKQGNWVNALLDLDTAASLPFQFTERLLLRLDNERILVAALRDEGDAANANDNGQNVQADPVVVVAAPIVPQGPLIVEAQGDVPIEPPPPALPTDVQMALQPAVVPMIVPIEFQQVVPPTDDERTRMYRDDVMFKTLGDPNPVLMSASEHLTLEKVFLTSRRHIVTEVELEPAATVIVEKPYATVTTGALVYDHDYCHLCLKKIELMVPCNECVFAVYCSVECRSRDKEVHIYECLCLGILHIMKAEPCVHLALRCLCRAGPAYIYGMYLERNANTHTPVRGIDPRNGLYESDSYHQIIHLKGVCSAHQVATLSWMALACTQILDTYTKFFKKLNIESKLVNDFRVYVATLLLKNFEAVPQTAIHVHRQRDTRFNDVPTQPDASIPIAVSIYSLTSMLTHSCDPNISKYIRPDGTMALVTNRHLKKGTELTISLGPHYGYYDLRYRQSIIRFDHTVDCACIACTMNYPKFVDFPKEVRWYCEECKVDFDRFPLDELVKSCAMKLDDNGDGTCPTCQKVVKDEKLDQKSERFGDVITKGSELVRLKKYADAVVLYADAVKYFQYHIAPPSSYMVQVQKRLSDVLLKVMLLDEEQRQ